MGWLRAVRIERQYLYVPVWISMCGNFWVKLSAKATGKVGLRFATVLAGLSAGAPAIAAGGAGRAGPPRQELVAEGLWWCFSS